MTDGLGYEHLAGTVFAPGEYTLSAHHAWLWSDSVGADPDEGVQLSVAYMVAMRGGASIESVMEVLETEAEQTLFGELGFEFAAPLAVGRTYTVESELIAVEPKQGRRIPCFDRVTLEYRIAERESDEEAARISQVWIVARHKRVRA
jgi:hypothetical protein